MLNKIKNLIKENRTSHLITQAYLKELDWANTYHDSIRGKKWLEELPLNIGRWAGNYSFFYILNRILSDVKPASILELGLGESTKFINAYMKNMLHDSNHDVIEHDDSWALSFKQNNDISHRTSIISLPLTNKLVHGFETKGYENIEKIVNNIYDLYLVDGPFGSNRFSRYDIVNIFEQINTLGEFVILMDDYNRDGEKETVEELLKVIKNKELNVYYQEYSGSKSVLVLSSEKYKFTCSL